MKTFEIIAGTSEAFLLGYDFDSDNSSLTQSFATHDHNGSLRSLAVSGRYVASGGVDDRIIIYDFKLRKECTMLTHHKSTVNCLGFTKNHSHIISASEDGVLSIVRVGNFNLEKIWDKAHKGEKILDVAVHSSGKLALTLGADGTLRTWNLVKGRQAYAVNLNIKSRDRKLLEKVTWAEDGVRFVIYGGKYTEIWSIEVGGVLKSIEHPDKVVSCIWYSDKEILVGYDNGEIALIEIDTLKKDVRKAHDTRVKAICQHLSWLVTASSSGEIKVWNRDFDELAKCNSNCRINCLQIIPQIDIKKEEKEDVELEEKEDNFQMNTKRTVVIEDGSSAEDSDSDEEIIENIEKPKQNKVSLKTEVTERKGEILVVENSQSERKKHKKKRKSNDVSQSNVKKTKKKKLR
nr:p21-activated protein kinase-interacting protein 1-like [Leptinotarsa decemlineata]